MLVCLGYSIGPMILATKLADVAGTYRRHGRDRGRRARLAALGDRALARSISGETWSCVAVLSVVCTVAAFLTFFQLVQRSRFDSSRRGHLRQYRHRGGARHRRTARAAHRGYRGRLSAGDRGLRHRDEQSQPVLADLDPDVASRRPGLALDEQPHRAGRVERA